MKRKIKYSLIIILLLITIAMSICLSFIPLEKACGQSGSCTIVQTSNYETIFGINNAYLGLIAFPILFFLILLESKKTKKIRSNILKIGIISGSIVASYFLYIQFFILKAICKYCLITDIATLLIFILIFWKEK